MTLKADCVHAWVWRPMARKRAAYLFAPAAEHKFWSAGAATEVRFTAGRAAPARPAARPNETPGGGIRRAAVVVLRMLNEAADIGRGVRM
jgi:hypothetical protein